MTKSTKPDCSDFIVAAVRLMRVRHPKMKKRTASGVAVHRLYPIAMQAYTPEQFREGVAKGVKEKKIVVPAKVYEQKEDGDWQEEVLLSEIPISDYLDKSPWYFDADGKAVPHFRDKPHSRPLPPRHFDEVRIYVLADGLPDRIKALLPDARFHKYGKVTAQKIIASMRQPKRS